MDKRVVPISVPSTGEAEWNATRESFTTGWLAQGPKVAAFEAAFAERHQTRFAVAASSGTTALHLILAAMEIGPGDEVIVPAFTWVATANAVLYCGATPVFADIDPRTFNLDPPDVAAKVTSHTKAVLAVHLFGLPADMDAITAAAPGAAILEDAACAAGAAYKGKPAGSLGLAAAFSFHPRKTLTTGEGGMVTTSDAGLAERLLMLRNHGASLPNKRREKPAGPHQLPEYNLLGFNYRLTDLQAAVGLVQLAKLDDFINERRQRAEMYRQKLADLDWLICPQSPGDSGHSYQAFVTWVDPDKAPLPRNDIMDQLQAAGVSTRPGTHAVHMLGLYRDRFGIAPDDHPNARDADLFSMAIPLHNCMTDADYDHVIDALHRIG